MIQNMMTGQIVQTGMAPRVMRFTYTIMFVLFGMMRQS